MNCFQCGNKIRIKFDNRFCSSSCAGFKPREKPKGTFKVEDDKVIYVNARTEPIEEMPVHYVIEDSTPEKIARRHAEKVKSHNVRNALKREFLELRGK